MYVVSHLARSRRLCHHHGIMLRYRRGRHIIRAVLLCGAILGLAVQGAWLLTLTLTGSRGGLRGLSAEVAALVFFLSGWRRDVSLPKHRMEAVAALLLLSVPVEVLWGASLDFLLQMGTTYGAATLVRATGLAVAIGRGPSPLLFTDDLQVMVTPLCAGCHTILAMLTLGVVAAETFLYDVRSKHLFVLLVPLLGFCGNVLRVAVSTHAANRWAGRGMAWDIAHDVIGYVTFVGVYAVAFACLLLRRRATRPTPTHARTSMSMPTIQAP